MVFMESMDGTILVLPNRQTPPLPKLVTADLLDAQPSGRGYVGLDFMHGFIRTQPARGATTLRANRRSVSCPDAPPTPERTVYGAETLFDRAPSTLPR